MPFRVLCAVSPWLRSFWWFRCTLLFVQLFASRVSSHCKHDMGTLLWLNAGTLERAPTLLFDGLVRCSAHGRSFARLRYMKTIGCGSFLPYSIRCQVSSIKLVPALSLSSVWNSIETWFQHQAREQALMEWNNPLLNGLYSTRPALFWGPDYHANYQTPMPIIDLPVHFPIMNYRPAKKFWTVSLKGV